MTSKTKARLLASGNNGVNNSTSGATASSLASSSSSSSTRARRRRHRDEPTTTSTPSTTTTSTTTPSTSSSSRRGHSGRRGSSSSSGSSGNKGGHSGATGAAEEHFDDDNNDQGNGAGAVRYEDEEPVFQSQLYALEEFERAFVSERAALGLAPVSNNSNNANGDSSASSSRSHRRRHRGGQSPVSSSPPRRRRSSPQSVLLTTAGVPLLDALLENIVVMKSGRWDCIELISAPAFGEVVRVEDQGILLIAPTRTHIHIPNQSSDAKLCVLNHLLETLQYPHTAEFDESKTTIVLVNSDNGVRADLRTPVIVPTPLYLRSERATRGIIIAMPGEIVVSPSGRLSPKSTAAANGTTAAAAAAVVTESPSEPAAPAVATGDNAAAIAKRKNKMSRVQWRLSRNMAMEFRPDQEH